MSANVTCSQVVKESTEVVRSLGKKSESEVLALLKRVNEHTLQALLGDLPVGWLRDVVELDEEKRKQKAEENKEKKEAAKKEAKEKEEQAKGEAEAKQKAEEERRAREEARKKKQEQEENRKRHREQKSSFASFYARIKKSVEDARHRGTLEMHVFGGRETGSLEEALFDAEMDPSLKDPELSGVTAYVAQALVAEKGLNSFTFSQVYFIGQRFSEVFRFHQQRKETERFIRKDWLNYADYLKTVAPGMDPRQERNYRRTYELAEAFPCIRLISGCSVHEFWLHMREFRDLLESNDHDAAMWRSPLVECVPEKFKPFERTIEYQTVEGENMLPFAQTVVQGREQHGEAFQEEVDVLLQEWREEEEAHGERKRARPVPPVDDYDYDYDFIDDGPMDIGSESYSEGEYEEDEEEEE